MTEVPNLYNANGKNRIKQSVTYIHKSPRPGKYFFNFSPGQLELWSDMWWNAYFVKALSTISLRRKMWKSSKSKGTKHSLILRLCKHYKFYDIWSKQTCIIVGHADSQKDGWATIYHNTSRLWRASDKVALDSPIGENMHSHKKTRM